jgi:hypothetical protein
MCIKIMLMFGLITKILLSPVVVFIGAYIYFGDFRQATFTALLFYSALTVISLIFSGFQMAMSMATFNIFKFVRKSMSVIIMTLTLGLYWLAYLLMWGSNFNLSR